MRRTSQILLAKEGPKGSGGSPAGQEASGSSWVGPEASPPFKPIDNLGPKYGDLVRLKYGDEVRQGIRDPHGWFTAGHLALIPGQPDSWAPLEEVKP